MPVGKKYSTQWRTLEAGADTGTGIRRTVECPPRRDWSAEGGSSDPWSLTLMLWLIDYQTLAKLQKDTVNVLYCCSHVCHLAASAAVELSGNGYPVMKLEGGWRWWKNDGFDIDLILKSDKQLL